MNFLASFFCFVSLFILFAYANTETTTKKICIGCPVTQPIEKADKYRHILEHIYNQNSTDKYYAYIAKMNKYTTQVANGVNLSFYLTMARTGCLKENVYKNDRLLNPCSLDSTKVPFNYFVLN